MERVRGNNGTGPQRGDIDYMYYGVPCLLLVLGVTIRCRVRPFLVSVLLLMFLFVRMSLARLTKSTEVLRKIHSVRYSVSQGRNEFTSLISFRLSSPVRLSRPCSASSGSCLIFPLISSFKPSTFSLIVCAGVSSVNLGLWGGENNVYVQRPFRIQDQGQRLLHGVEADIQSLVVRWDSYFRN